MDNIGRIIGTWKGYNISLIEDPDMVDGHYWTITDDEGNEKNRFESGASFGHWVYHTGWRPDTSRKGKLEKIQKSLKLLASRRKQSGY